MRVTWWVKATDWDEAEVVGTWDRPARRGRPLLRLHRRGAEGPRTFGDPIRVIETLPGAARPAYGTGQLVIRGSNPEDTGIYIDGIRIPRIYHLGGYESVSHPEPFGDVQYFPGDFGVEYGRSTGGAVNVVTKDDYGDQPRVVWSTDFLDSGGVFTGRFGDHEIGIAARRSYVDALLSAVPGVGSFASPVWSDYQLRYAWKGREDVDLSIFALGMWDSLKVSLPEGGFGRGPGDDGVAKLDHGPSADGASHLEAHAQVGVARDPVVGRRRRLVLLRGCVRLGHPAVARQPAGRGRVDALAACGWTHGHRRHGGDLRQPIGGVGRRRVRPPGR